MFFEVTHEEEETIDVGNETMQEHWLEVLNEVSVFTLFVEVEINFSRKIAKLNFTHPPDPVELPRRRTLQC